MANALNLLAGRPLAIMPERIAAFAEAMAAHNGVDALSPEVSRFVGRAPAGSPVRTTENGVAVISVVGALINRGALLGENWGISTYEGLQFKLESAAKDPKIRAIILDFESPGGEVSGCFETAALIRKINSEKPVVACVNGLACSAAFALASACRSIISTESGVSGSIGVVLLHSDISGALDKAGISPTLIYAGKHKTDANPFEALNKEVKGDLQAEVDRYYSMFVTAVAQGRRNLTEAAIRDTQARTFIGRDALAAGLVDQIGVFGDLLADLERNSGAARATASNSTSAHGVKKPMSDTEKYFIRAAERDRIKAILDSPEGQWNPTAAKKIAFSTSASIEEARAELRGGGSQDGASASSTAAMWDDAIATVNAEERRNSGRASAAAPKQAGAVSWDSVAAKLNSERGVSKHGV